MKCVFCDMENGRKIRESKNTYTIFSDPYLLKGHCLVIPKKHYEGILEIPDNILFELIKEVKVMEGIVLKSFNGPGADIRQHYRPFQKESNLKINHLHFHIIPRSFEDELYQKSMVHEKEVFKRLDEETRRELTRKLLSINI